MNINAQCLNCGEVFKDYPLSILNDKNLSHFIGDFAKLKYCKKCYKEGL